MKYVIGVDLGTSAVKLLLIDQEGNVAKEVTKPYPLFHEKMGYSEQDPEDWTAQTFAGLAELAAGIDPALVEGISFSGQMHGLVLLDENQRVLRNAILWNDTRTTAQCREIERKIGKEKLLQIAKNPALEGFTLPKLLWVKEHEPKLYERAAIFLLPKDYVRFRLTGTLEMDYSDAAGTLLLDVERKQWSKEICDLMGIDPAIYPPLVESIQETGTLTEEAAAKSGLPGSTKVFAGGADNACGAIGSGILSEGKTLCSIGTSGVVLAYEENADQDFHGKVHYFNHAAPGSYYTMGVTLSAGHSLTWFRDVFAKGEPFEALLEDVESVPPGSRGLLFTPYLSGERTPHADSVIRASFIGMDSSHERKDFVRAVLEGITFSLLESIRIFRKNGKKIDRVISIGGGAKSEAWLQMQADIFNASIVKLKSEQGPGMGAAMIAAVGCGWFESLELCAARFLTEERVYEPDAEKAGIYAGLYDAYRQVYEDTKGLNEKLAVFRN